MRPVVRTGPTVGGEMTQVSARDSFTVVPALPRPRVVTRRSDTGVTTPGDPPPHRRSTARWAPLATEAAATATVATAATVLLGAGAAPVGVMAVGWLLMLVSSGHHRRPALGESAGAAAKRVLLAGAKAFVLAAASAPLVSGTADPGDLLWLAVAFTITSTLVTVAAPVRGARVVLLGPPQEVRSTLVELGSTGRHEIVAVCATRRTRTPFGEVPSYCGIRDVTRAIAEHEAEALVVLAGSQVSQVDLRRLQWEVARAGAALYLGTGLLDVSPRRTRMVTASGLDVLHVAPAPLTGPRRFLKDAVERSLALVGLVLLSPLLLALAVLVRRDTPGPALFRQERVGRDGRTFEMLKFRSMTLAAESERDALASSDEGAGVLFKIRQDPRVSPVGRWLRRYSLDELPQLWNVVRGDMSLVGPRPALPQEVAKYDVDPLRRLVVKPGVTGLWQVSGRSDLSWEETVRLDLRYVDNWTLAFDVAILVRTVRAVLSHRGAY